MPAYWVARSKINDPVEYKKYTDLVPGIIAKFGGKVLARGGRFQIMEGPGQVPAFRGDRVSDLRAGRRLLHLAGIRPRRGVSAQGRRRGRNHHGRRRRSQPLMGQRPTSRYSGRLPIRSTRTEYQWEEENARYNRTRINRWRNPGADGRDAGCGSGGRAERRADQDRLQHGAHRRARAQREVRAPGAEDLGRGRQCQRRAARPAGEARLLR